MIDMVNSSSPDILGTNVVTEKLSKKQPGEFQIKRGFLNEDFTAHFAVSDPVLHEDHVEYSVCGIDMQTNERFQVSRRYRDFVALRAAWSSRWPGMYIPPVPKKYIVGNTSIQVLKERSFLLNIFLKQSTRCPYLLESLELMVFISPSN